MQHIAAETRVYVTETPVSATFSTQIKEKKRIYIQVNLSIYSENKNKGAVVGRMRAPTHARARGAPRRHRRRFF